MPELAARADALDFVAATLLIRASKVSRMLMAGGENGLSRTEAGLLGTLMSSSRRITELARTEALAQPSVTRVVDNLERRDLVAREHSPEDRRVVLVAITAAGRDALEAVRARNRAQMRDLLVSLDDDQVAHLASASESLGQIVDVLGAPESAR
jgi:DNA-binding MarR family transcriptional regulator